LRAKRPRGSRPLGRKLSLAAWFYTLSILINVGACSTFLLFYFEPAFRESNETFQAQQQLERLRGRIAPHRADSGAVEGFEPHSDDALETVRTVAQEILWLRNTSVPEILNLGWPRIEALAGQLATEPAAPGERLKERLEKLEFHLTWAINAVATRRQDSAMRAFHAQRRLTGLLILNSLLGATLCGVGLWCVRRWVVQPAAILKDATHRIRQGDFDPQVRLCFDDEMGMLGREIVEMARQIGRLQARLVHNERRAAAEEMVERVENRIRDPLAQIWQLAQTCASRRSNAGEVAECLEGIVATVRQFEEWLGQLKSGLSCTPAQPCRTPVSTILANVRAAVGPALERHQVQLVLDASEALGLVSVDRLPFEQALVCLITNAVQASSAGQSVRVAAGICEHNGESWQIEVSDQGSGIPAPLLERVFLPFFTTKADGNGLGLSMAKSIVEQHGGRLLVRSKPGEGSCFTLQLPLASRAEAASDAKGHAGLNRPQTV
jgi:signal transduction histidine kinase